MNNFKQTAPLVITAIIAIAGLVFLARYSTNGVGPSSSSPAAVLAGYLSAPYNFSAVPISATKIELKWDDTSFASPKKYRIERSSYGHSWAQIAAIAPNSVDNLYTSSYVDTGQTIGTAYYYRVRVADNYNMFSPYSSEVMAMIPNVAPVAPANLLASVATSTQINLIWQDKSNNEVGFKIDRSTDQVVWKTLSFVAKDGVQAYSDTNVTLTKVPVYYYRVYAYNSFGNSPYSNITKAVDAAKFATAPSGVVAIAKSSNQIDVRWQDNSTNEDGFIIQRSTDNTNFSTVKISPPHTGSEPVMFYDASVGENARYYYRVAAFNSFGTSTYPDSTYSYGVTPAFAQNNPACYASFTLNETKNSTGGVTFSYNGTPKSVYGYYNSAIRPYNPDTADGIGYGIKVYQGTYLLNQYNVNSGRLVLFDNFPDTDGQVEGGSYMADTGIIDVIMPQDSRITDIVITNPDGTVLAHLAPQASMNAACTIPR